MGILVSRAHIEKLIESDGLTMMLEQAYTIWLKTGYCTLISNFARRPTWRQEAWNCFVERFVLLCFFSRCVDLSQLFVSEQQIHSPKTNRHQDQRKSHTRSLVRDSGRKLSSAKSFDQKLPGDPLGDRGPGTFSSNDFLLLFHPSEWRFIVAGLFGSQSCVRGPAYLSPFSSLNN